MEATLGHLQLPEELSRLILSGTCVAFIGSGVSAGCYDSWPDLVNNLCERCGSTYRVERDSPGEALLDAAQSAKDADQQAYYSFLGEHFGEPADRVSLLYDALLSLPFTCYLTVNFDPLLALKARTAKISCDTQLRMYPSLDRKAMTRRSIHYLHGYIAEGSMRAPGTIVLARDEFQAAYADNSNLMNFLVQTLEFDPMVFIGCRLQEPTMARVFEICKKHQEVRLRLAMESGRGVAKPPARFIFLAEPQVKSCRDESGTMESGIAAKKEEAYYANMDIKPVWYKARGENHSALRFALEYLAKLPEIEVNYGGDGGANGI
jgi:hypothetical protein